MSVIRVLSAAALSLSASIAFAVEPEQNIRAALTQLQPDMPIESISLSPMPGLYQVQLPGGRLLYASADGQYLLQGSLYQVVDGKAKNLTAETERVGVAELINAIPKGEMVVFPAQGETKTHISVFTDTDCGYCQKLHAEVPELNRRGIEVRYLAFPRQGAGSNAHKTLVNIWCAKDPLEAMNRAKARKSVEDASCDNPVMKQFELGQMIGVNGTPSIVLANGDLIPGYQPAPQLAEAALSAQ